MGNDGLFRWICHRGGILSQRAIQTITRRLNSPIEDDVLPPAIIKAWQFLLQMQVMLQSHDVDVESRPILREIFPHANNWQIEYFKPYATISLAKSNRSGEEESSDVDWLTNYMRVEFHVDNNMGLDFEQSKSLLPETWNNSVGIYQLAMQLGSWLDRILDGMRSLGKIEPFDMSTYYVKTLYPHTQNTYCDSWTVIVRGLAECIDKLSDLDAKLAKHCVDGWALRKDTLYKRLYIHSMRNDGLFLNELIIEYIFQNNAAYLWKSTLKTEVLSVLRQRWSGFTTAQKQEVERIAQIGPPPDEAESENKTKRECDSYRLLLWLQESLQYPLSDKAKAYLLEVKERNSSLPVKVEDWYEVNRFVIKRIGREQDPVVKDYNYIFSEKTPLDDALALLQPTKDEFGGYYEWGFIFKNVDLHPSLIQFALRVAEHGIELSWFWNDFVGRFECVCKRDKNKQYLEDAFHLIDSMPKEVLKNHSIDLSRLWSAYSSVLHDDADRYFPIWKRHLLLFLECKENDAPINQSTSLNQHMGIMVRALLEDYLNQGVEFGVGLPNYVKESYKLLNSIKTSHPFSYKCGLDHWGRYLYSIHGIDEEWCQKNLIPLFQKDSDLFSVVWSAYLRLPYIDPPLFVLLKPHLGDAIRWYSLEKSQSQEHQYLIRMITEMSIRFSEELSPIVFKEWTQHLDEIQKSWCTSAIEYLFKPVRNSENEEELRHNRDVFEKQLCPWLDKKYWPVTNEYRSLATNSDWIRIMLSVRTPDAFKRLLPFLKPGIENYSRWNRSLGTTPAFYRGIELVMLDLLVFVTPKEGPIGYCARELSRILDHIAQSDANIMKNQKFMSLKTRLNE